MRSGLSDVSKGSGIQKGEGSVRTTPNIPYSVSTGRGRAGNRARAAQFSTKKLLEERAWVTYILIPELTG